MNNTQLLQELDQQLSKINAQREAHVEIQQIMDFYKNKVKMEAQMPQKQRAESNHKETE